MGNEQSCEAAATKARQEMVEFIHRNGAEESEKARILMDERAAKFRVDAALQQHQESEGLIQQSLRSEREEGEILSQDSEPAQIPFPQPSQVGSSQQVPDRSNVLAAWQPRIEKQRSHGQQPNAAATPDGEFIGFGYLEASQRDQTQAESSRKPSCPQPKAPVTPKAVSGANQKAPTSTNSIIKERSDGSRLTKPLKVGRPSKPTSGDRSDSRSGASASKPPAAATASSSTALPAKRPAQTAFADERRRSLATLPKIPKRSSVASPQSPQGQVDQLQAVGDERPPRWYKDTPRPTTRQKDKGTVDVDLSNLRDFIENAKVAFKARDKVKWSKAISDLRESLHTLIFLEVTGPLLKLHRTLDNEAGLPLIFDSKYNGKVDWPFDVQADAEELYNKWCRKVFETDILRGIQFGGKDGSSKNDASIKPGYKIEAKYHGNGDLKNGQWWPYQICALRDGAHGRTQGTPSIGKRVPMRENMADVVSLHHQVEYVALLKRVLTPVSWLEVQMTRARNTLMR
jgi:hypothetical protein